MELLDMWSPTLLGFNFLYFQNLNCMRTSPVTCTHITITLCNSLRDSHVSVFSVHVVGSTT